jgi:hypothetical protein
MTFHEKVKERNNGGISLNGTIVFSFLLHALVLSIIFFSSFHAHSKMDIWSRIFR